MSQKFRMLKDLSRPVMPALSRLLNSVRPLREGLEFLSEGIDFVQGRSSGYGWNYRGEALAAARFLSGVDEPVIFDVGANYGQWAAAMTSVLGCRQHRMYLFEPQQACHEALVERLSAGRVLIPVALGAESGTTTMYAASRGCSEASTYAPRRAGGRDLATHRDIVTVTTVDQEVARLGLDRIDLMKIDVEGAELDVLRGAEAVLSTGRVTTLTFEFGCPNLESRVFFQDFWNLLEPIGYQLWRICPGGVLFPIFEYQERLEHFSSVGNYIASVRQPGPPLRPIPRMRQA
ncbi:FkbM family methyltransferase [Streptomyces lutosisoli]|uniref:FkbM family methyltransferase n=1 Tax=Streptomyces lutosisoli TaxID=2665721 RepID=A0ABW2VHE7_9ACTN